ncbi:hypothetical protein SCLCIDRAFT_124814 [Scleroderma citrinum Foug A]|uniref:Uncharacterized protein n=1 Tax=Scleroderma citrinum Foug A TaxID=1036808 RepID=A0A0C3DVG4_9AGAM|nr:hypothetical protein SCLCIDRAFT_124814 [Scleroderma citrinum Foug A]
MTCDNASNNDQMIEELHTLVVEFAGSASHTRCFLHIINLIAKMLIQQFDAKKTMTEADSELAEMGKELNEDECLLDEVMRDNEDEDERIKEENDKWVDETEGLDMEERIQLERSIRPVKLVLVKVRQHIRNSPSSLICCSAL